MKTRLFVSFLVLAAFTSTGLAQTPAPVTVQAAPAATRAVTQPTANNSASLQSALKAVFALRGANAEILKKQEATLLQIEELAKAAEQIKVYSKRG